MATASTSTVTEQALYNTAMEPTIGARCQRSRQTESIAP
jgi:hypothetical protein